MSDAIAVYGMHVRLSNSFLICIVTFLLYLAVMIAAMFYTMFRLYRNYEDEIIPVDVDMSSDLIVKKSFIDSVVSFFTSIFHITATFKCVPAFVAALQVRSFAERVSMYTVYP
jgi:hypothetical protein